MASVADTISDFDRGDQQYSMSQEEATEALTTVKNIPDNTDLDPKAVRKIPRDVPNMVGVIMADNDAVVVCWDHIPTPQEVIEASRIAQCKIVVGMVASTDSLNHIRKNAEKFHDTQSEVAERLIQTAIDHGSTDLHIAVGSPPKIRVGGRLNPMPDFSLITTADMDELIRFLIKPELIAEFNENHDVDTSATYAGWRMRISLYQQRYSTALALRIIPRVIPELEDLGVPAKVKDMLYSHSQGLFLVCGVTGSGKSTTLAAGLNNLNRDKDLHILTLEDPIEYIHEDRKATVHQREIGPDTNTFKTALRHALRQDPDIILVGEMRDYETMQMALEAAETGHLVLATVHSRDSGAVVKRLVASFPAHQQEQVRMQLADALIGVVIQKLVPSATSVTARHLATEIMTVDSAIANMIRQNKLHEISSHIATSGNQAGMHLMDHSLAQLLFDAKITREVAYREAADKATLDNEFNKIAEQHHVRRRQQMNGAA